MKSLTLQNTSFRYLEKSFKEWLDILGYAESTVYGLPLHVRELLHYLEKEGIKNIQQLKPQHIKEHYSKLSQRANNRRNGALSQNHLNKHIQAIRKFCDYLRQVGRYEIPDIPLRNEKANSSEPTFLSQEEIQEIFKATETEYPKSNNRFPDFVEAIKSRDRAMLAIFYGCGARRNEGVNLNVEDINWDRSILHIKKGKRYKERLVPIGKQALNHLQEWVYDYRPLWIKSKKIDALFISERGTRVSGQSLFLRLKIIQSLSKDEHLKQKEIGLHSLRHSIATHLLQNGMKLESISRFLGHGSLEPTQIYTHLAETNEYFD